ncbi:MAG: hypothetical protein Q9160_002319 [Pyrenula sp. 1 TL-2023]
MPHQPQPQPHMAYPQQPGSPPPVHMQQQVPLSSGSPPPMQQQWSYNSGQMGTPPAQPQQQPPFQQQQPMAYAPAAGSQYQTAVAIPNLGMGSAPVDCPSCGRRGMTRTEYVVGNTTQYVPLHFSSSTTTSFPYSPLPSITNASIPN